MRRLLPVVTLVLLAGLVSEVLIGNLPFDAIGAIAFVSLLPIYGGGALLVRELVRRTGRGWSSILLLGAAYGIVEEGIGLQAMFSPTIYDGAGPALGGRLFGVNGVYTELQLVNHAVWSVAVPVLLVELMFPARRRQPYLGRIGLTVTAFVYLLGVGLVVLSTHTTLDPGYWAPAHLLVGAAVAVLALAVVALRVLPRAGERVRLDGAAPPPWQPFVVALAGALCFLGLLVLPGDAHLAFVRGPLAAIPMLAALAVVVVGGWVLTRWSGAAGWDDRHALAVGAGALLGHSVIWGITQPRTWPDRIVVMVLFAASVALLWLLCRRVVERGSVSLDSATRDSG